MIRSGNGRLAIVGALDMPSFEHHLWCPLAFLNEDYVIEIRCWLIPWLYIIWTLSISIGPHSARRLPSDTVIEVSDSAERTIRYSLRQQHQKERWPQAVTICCDYLCLWLFVARFRRVSAKLYSQASTARK